jgi:glycine/D-amino acid oxidase-like deaminating enzyme
MAATSTGNTAGDNVGGRNVCVVGAGIMGLTCASKLADQGHNVTIVAKDTIHSAVAARAPNAPYTSSGSGGLWYVSSFPSGDS